MKQRVLVTGGAGFVGASLVDKLVSQNFQVHLLVKRSTNLWRIKRLLGKIKLHNADLTDKRRLVRTIKKIKPDYIFHLATRGAYPTQQDPYDMIETNIVGTMNLLSALEKINYMNLVVAGSSSEYGKKNKPMKESDNLEPNNYYGATKAAQTLLVSSWSKKTNKSSIILRFFAVYGPDEEEGRLVRNVIEAALNNEPVKLATGKEARDFIYIDDIVDACFAAMKIKSPGGEVFNVGTGRQSTIKELAEKVLKLTGSKSKIVLNAYEGRPWDAFNWVADMTKVKRILKATPKYNLLSGLKKTIQWYTKQG